MVLYMECVFVYYLQISNIIKKVSHLELFKCFEISLFFPFLGNVGELRDHDAVPCSSVVNVCIFFSVCVVEVLGLVGCVSAA